MTRKTNKSYSTRKRVARKPRRKTKVAAAIAGLVTGILSTIGGIFGSIKNVGDKSFEILKLLFQTLSPSVALLVETLGKYGINALKHLNDDFENNSNEFNTENAKKVIRIMKKKLLERSPSYVDDPIFNDFNKLNKSLYIIEGMSARGMNKETLAEVKANLKAQFEEVLKKFNKLMQ